MKSRKKTDPELSKTPEKKTAAASEPARFPIVGIGASAGGLAAFEAFFSGMPANIDPEMAFVLVQHLAPDHKSILADLIRRYTRMHVFEVEDGMRVKPNCAYIIPPNRDMAFLNGSLQLLEPEAPHGFRLPIDFFFRSLAQDQHDRAIGIVLSGTGSDGTLGLRAIKGEGGMAMVQNPASTEYDGMPRSAIATGLVDYELPPAEMPAQLISYVAHAFGRSGRSGNNQKPKIENALKKVFVLLRAQTGHDFSQYKPSTINRRVERRMAVHQIETMNEYVQYLQQTPAEIKALFGDLLISVTSFFRDGEALKALEENVIPKLFQGKPAGGVIRVWSAGCATGEEAYSLVIMLTEYQELLKQSYKIQFFATDIDTKAIVTARTGIYPANIAEDVSPERLDRFFTPELDDAEKAPVAYRVKKHIRDMLVFSEQDVIKDPPFSKMDLISCRNLMIYMGGDLQKRLIPLFHYALKPGGFLFLGTSETIGDFGDLFHVVDRKLKLYQRKESFQKAQNISLASLLPSKTHGDPSLPVSTEKTVKRGNVPIRELAEQVIHQQTPLSAAFVDGHGDILYLHGRTDMFLEPVSSESVVNNILKVAREGLRHDLTTALRKASESKEIVQYSNLHVKTDEEIVTVNMTVRPVASRQGVQNETPLFLVIVEQVQLFNLVPPSSSALPDTGNKSEARILSLQQELRAKDVYLQATFEELETANEELESSNEEMQSVNEELQSTNEELETSKEELQSVNEELSTVNNELESKVTDLSRTNNDMNNLLAGTGVGTLFVDMKLRITRFTPAVVNVINLIQSDVGRPVGHIVSNLYGYDSLVEDTQTVLDSLIPKEITVRTKVGIWYLMRILPYRTLENVIKGAVITFIDITERKKMEAVLRETQVKLSEGIVATVREPLLVLDESLRVVSANRAFYTNFQVGADMTIGRTLYDLGNHQWEIPALRKLLEEILPQNTVVTDYEVSHVFEKIGKRTMLINARCLFSESGSSELFLLAIGDITDKEPRILQ
ncbi:MAG: chemotaxis protein CheB [Treponemataceae bacterium]